MIPQIDGVSTRFRASQIRCYNVLSTGVFGLTDFNVEQPLAVLARDGLYRGYYAEIESP
jgi:hypothetical protein